MLYMHEFPSINSFYKYLCDTPYNSVFEDEFFRRSDEQSDKRTKFVGTESFQEAIDLMLHGWEIASETLAQKLNASKTDYGYVTRPRNVLSVSGYQPVVPLYLAGVPTSMVDRRMVPVKQKVVTITKMIAYNYRVSKEIILEESAKVLRVVKTLESQGCKVNLNIVCGFCELDDTEIICKVRIKNANERLNVSKIAFPLVHPSMLRRVMFRFLEVCPDTTEKYRIGYGGVVTHKRLKEIFPKDLVIPNIWACGKNGLKDLKSIQETLK